MLSVVLIWYFSLFFPIINVMANLIAVHVTDMVLFGLHIIQ